MIRPQPHVPCRMTRLRQTQRSSIFSFASSAIRKVLVNVWEQGAPVNTMFYSELQLIHYSEEKHADVACQAFGTSKPVCWTCGCCIDHLQCSGIKGDEEEEAGEVAERRWCYSKGSRRVYGEWTTPPSAKEDTMNSLFGRLAVRHGKNRRRDRF
ncbi:hypothetical protein IW262DRAFT_1015998 [Armillaria fumosa]|nr:hypothetical protein IW262DRAFT_1015998 [Armillaria fumosa]